jgi:LacI family transcriptional regulator
VHGRERRFDRYGWVDMDNYGNFYRLTRLLIANGHRHIAFINGDEHFNYALYRHNAVRDAAMDAGLPSDAVIVYGSSHPMGDAGFRLTQQALANGATSAVVYSSILLLMAGYELLMAAGDRGGRPLAIATMDDQLRHLDPARLAPRVSFVRSSLHDAGLALIEELSRQCDDDLPPRGTMIKSTFQIAPSMDSRSIDEPLPATRRGQIG